ncbi:hypothetical protein ACFLWK_01050 [Chloroflexota bacterium]
MQRPISLVIASLLVAVSGLLVIMFGAILIIGGNFLGGLLERIAFVSPEQLVYFGMSVVSPYITYLGIHEFGIIAIIWSVLTLFAAYGLWTLRKWGGYLTIGLVGLPIIVSSIRLVLIILGTIRSPFSVGFPFSIIDFVWAGLIIILVLVGWKRLSRQDAVQVNIDSNS